MTTLRTRMAAVFGVDERSVLPVQGLTQAVDLVMRRVAFDGASAVAAEDTPGFRQLAKINRLSLAPAPNSGCGAVFVTAPSIGIAPLSSADAIKRAAALRPALLFVDESLIAFEEAPSAVDAIGDADNLIVARGLEPYGLASCAALIASPQLIERLATLLTPDAFAPEVANLALNLLRPDSLAANTARLREMREERARVAAALPNASAALGPFVRVRPADRDAARREIVRYDIAGAWRDEAFLLRLSTPEANDRAIMALGGAPSRTRRRGEITRETKETRIIVRVDLDRDGASEINTGIGFYDHMLSQIAAHGGFSLFLSCAGDLEVDGHHTIEDCALALGEAMKQALGDRRGLARFGFLLPMDEAEAKVSIDLGGRPYIVFDGAFAAAHIGAYPTEMTEHVFRSLAQSMGASIHVAVTGENDHHKTEACYKAFGRALRQALRVEGDILPTTKGVL